MVNINNRRVAEPGRRLGFLQKALLEFGLAGQVGEFSIGSEFDAVWLHPVEGSTLDCGLRNADSADQALAKVFALGTDADVASVWIGGVQVSG